MLFVNEFRLLFFIEILFFRSASPHKSYARPHCSPIYWNK